MGEPLKLMLRREFGHRALTRLAQARHPLPQTARERVYTPQAVVRSGEPPERDRLLPSPARNGALTASAGGPLPRPAFRSFLATAGDPSPNFGGGVVAEMVQGVEDGMVRADGAPLSRPLPHKLRGGEVTRATDCRSGIAFSPSPVQFTGGGAGGWGRCPAPVGCPSQRPDLAPPPPPPRGLRGGGAVVRP